MLQRVLLTGLVSGALVGLPMIAMTILAEPGPDSHMSPIAGYAMMLVALSLIFLAVKAQRDGPGGGVIKFWPAFLLGLGVSAVAGIVYVVCWEVALALTEYQFANQYADALIAKEKANGMSGPALEKFIADMEGFKAQYANPFFRLPITFTEIFPVGLIVSLAAAALFRNPNFLPAKRG